MVFPKLQTNSILEKTTTQSDSHPSSNIYTQNNIATELSSIYLKNQKYMGQSNSTSPLVMTEANQAYKEYDFSRLVSNSNILNNESMLKGNKKDDKQFNYFRLHHFQCLNGDDLLVRDRQGKIVEKMESECTTLRNVSNLQLIKQQSSSHSKSKLTSISNFDMHMDQSLGPSLSMPQRRNSHVKFTQNNRIVCKNYIVFKTFNETTNKYTNNIINYFIEEEHMQNYISNLIKLKQLMPGISIYQDFTILEEDSLYIVERTYSEAFDFQKDKLTKKKLKENVELLLEYLCFLARLYEQVDGIYVDPEDVYYDQNCFYLVHFKFKQTDPFEMILATLQWIFKNFASDINGMIEQKLLSIFNNQKYEKTLEQCFMRRQQHDDSSLFPLFVRELWNVLVDKKIQRNQLLPYILRLKQKAVSMSFKIDSFHACLNHKKTYTFQQQKHSWLVAKRQNQLYFYNLNDEHRCQVKVVRKKKKIDLSQLKLVFDHEEIQIKYIAENSKLIVHVSQFELQKASCLSDIEIKHRLPVKFRNPYLVWSQKKQELFILQNSVYKYSIPQNKLCQETKKLTDCIFLAKSYEFSYMVIKMSIDIFRNGIRIFINHKDTDLMFVGEERLLQQMSNIRVDIRSVDFCKEIYKGVYLMLANKNLWILDANFGIFFTYATVERVKTFYGFASVANSSGTKTPNLHHHRHSSHLYSSEQTQSSDYAFQIFNQSFKVQFLSHQQGLNAKIKDEQLHIIGQIQGNLYYLKYFFLPQTGSLKLLQYKPLCGVDQDSKKCQKRNTNQKTQSPQNSNKSLDSNQQQKVKKKVRIASGQIDQIVQQNKISLFVRQSISPMTLKVPQLVLNSLQQKIGSNLNQTKLNNPLKNSVRSSNRSSIRSSNLPLKPLMHSSFDSNLYQMYTFNFHQQNLPSYKYQIWLYQNDKNFIKVQDFYMKTNKTNYEIQLTIPKLKCSIKDLIENMKKRNQSLTYSERKHFTKLQCVLLMLRCLKISSWLAAHHLYHKNFSIGNLYFTQFDNSLKLIGWSQPPRNWYVSDYRDLLLVFFNIITLNSLQKLNEKMLYKYKEELGHYGNVYEKMQMAYKYVKANEKKGEVQKDIRQIKESLLKELAVMLLTQNHTQLADKSNKQITNGTANIDQNNSVQTSQNSMNKFHSPQFIFNFQHNTPRFSMISTTKSKLKKCSCLLDQNSKQELIFKSTDKHLWNQQKGQLYIFTSTYQFYELKINLTNFKEQTLICEEYEYLPHNVLEATFILVPQHGIFAVGGIFKDKDGQLSFNKVVYKFNIQKLTWDAVCEIPEPRVNPYLVLSKDCKELYCMGGQVQHSTANKSIIKMTFIKNQLSGSQPYQMEYLIDPLSFNPFGQISSLYPTKIYNLSGQSCIFVLFSMSHEKYFVRIFSLTSFCLDLRLDAKNYSDDNKIIASIVGITLNKGIIHILRQYGKHAQISLNKLDNLTVVNTTSYPERQQQTD